MKRVVSIFIYFCLVALVAGGFILFFMVSSLVKQSGVELQVATTKSVYSPGERVGFLIKRCGTEKEYKNISYQLERHHEDKIVIRNLGQNKDVGLPVNGCIDLIDETPVLPTDLIEDRYRFLVRSDNPQNPFEEPKVYISNWFEVVE